MITNPDKIATALKGKLPGSESHYKMLPPERLLKPAPEDQSKVKPSSVLVLLFPDDDGLKVCLIKRPTYMKHHAGQIALPGGRIEANESACETALRETFEEIGITEDKIRILGTLSSFYVEVSRFQITPLVGWMDTKPEFKLCPDEVEKAILFPIAAFKPPHPTIELKTVTGLLTVPCIRYDGEIIWGATAMILSEFYDLIHQAE
ncbi:CoA pyrophosphatase [Draconibacterium sp. IB214405]|uniref:NUDIX hydrolase n=1 Tax=Draconibacterium sp. IB214405 TaxID=3097352 RepID=UPI002A145CC7|nr:CoA pyrophosphatase [Draconibacterium sp. IB214405]MDX8340995.1 CoA pyrophosphatase [Draconibacterium sp. IB214405]